MAPYERTFWTILAVLTLAIVGYALLIMLQMGDSSGGQGGRFYVAIGALAVFALVNSAIGKLVHRFAPFDIGTSEPERRYALLSLIVASAVVLFGVAWLLP
jgi:hypothetical protein